MTANANHESLPVGLAGLGGYAGTVCRGLLEVQQRPDAPVHLAAVYDPDPAAGGAELRGRLKESGVVFCGSWQELLAAPVEIIDLPLPIHLHRRCACGALAAGKAVLCEKPLAGSVQDVDAIADARDASGRPLLVGYQWMYDPTTLLLKRRLLEGAIGEVFGATVLGLAPRSRVYYQRNDWAGCLKRGGEWVLDGPAQNAMSHAVNLALFLMGEKEGASARVVRVEAELYRANPIENCDTFVARAGAADGADLVIAMTHACREARGPAIRIEGSDGRLEWSPAGAVLTGEDGSQPYEVELRPWGRMFGAIASLAAGGEVDPAVAGSTIETARPPVVVINAASQSAPVRDVPAERVRIVDRGKADEPEPTRVIEGIEEALRQCVEQGRLLSELGTIDWARPGEAVDTGDYRRFDGPRIE
jgi:predicted dehydrogenase